MSAKKRIASVVTTLAILVLCQPAGRPQSGDATVTGRVFDPSNAAILNATVTVLDIDRQNTYRTLTNNDGIFSVSGLIPGNYRIEVAKVGFKTVIKPDVTLHIQDVVAVNFVMVLGSVSETVTVEGGTPMVNTTSASVSTVVDQTYLKNMPLNGRSFQDLILLTPGTVTQTPQASGAASFFGVGITGEFSVNGQRMESNYYTVDGVSANVGAAAGGNMTQGAGASGSVPGGTALGTTQALVSVDALQEFRVQSSTYSAEYGRNPGGQFSFETKSGTNLWHGTAYDYLRNNYFDANDWFNNYFGVKGAALRQNDFGGTLGGPVWIPGLYNGKDKTFFFFSYEGLRLAAPQPASISFVPDAALRSAAPVALQPVLNAFPVSNGPDDTVNGFAQYIASWSNPSSLDSTGVRFDHVVNDKLRLFFRFSDTGSNSATRGTGSATPAMHNVSAYTLRTYTAGASSVFSSRLSNDFRLNFSSNETTSSTVIPGFGGGTPINFQQLLGAHGFVLFFSGPYFTYLLDSLGLGTQRQWNLVDTVSRSLGRHQLKFGVDYRRLAPFAFQNAPSGTIVDYAYFDKASVETNSAFTFPQVNAPAHPLYMNFSAFAQDEWRVSHRLSLSLGLRWEVNPAPGVTQGLKPYTIQGSSPSTWSLAPQGTPLWQTAWYNFAPRLGAVYILHNTPDRETVVRGGGGVFFDTGQQLGSQGFYGTGLIAFGDFASGGAFPVLPAIPALVNPPVVPYQPAPSVFPSHLQLPYTLQWNASIEQALGKSQALTVSYVGAHASRLLAFNFISTPSNPNASGFGIVESGLTSDYDALQIQFRRRLSYGLTALASYTWSHCIDFGSQNWYIGYQRGNCDFDVRHNLAAAISYDLPNVGHNGFMNAVLHNWGLDDRFTARTAFPVNINGGTFFDPLTGQQTAKGVDLVSSQPVYLYGANCASILKELGDLQPTQGCPGGRAINPCGFVNVGGSTAAPCPTNGTVVGLAPRNFTRGFGAWQMDLAVRRDFPIHERLRLQFRGEAFNIFNHPNFGSIDPTFGSRTFGQATGTLANSLGVLNPLYQMGGPRSMQFALKLVF